MIPGCEEILRLAQEYDTIPVCREIYADVVTPITLLRRMAGRSKRFFLLESVEGGEKWGRYSFLGCDPVLRVTLKTAGSSPNGRTARGRRPKRDGPTISCGDFKDQAFPRSQGHAAALPAVLWDYFAYAMIGYAEPTLSISRGREQDFDLMLFDEVIAYDHLKQKISVVVNMETRDKSPETLLGAYGTACGRIEAIVRMIRDLSPLPESGPGRAKGFFQQLFPKRNIAAG